ncbi:MAG: glycoside hydrolase family 125 protein [Chloroflexota bacterium]|nr:glycoside hydrolase family 125 protein [Chloroflexota bacterium]
MHPPQRRERRERRERRLRLLVAPEHARRLRRVAAHGLDYVRECTALRVTPGRVAIIADHRILPLSWTRDAYYQALLLLAAGETAGGAAGRALVADHLRWLWLSCERPNAGWARSHHANGRRKDERFQADQQLYPLLELADFWRVSRRLPELEGGASADRRAWSALVSDVLRMLELASAPTGLLGSEENAADDPLAYPYHFSTQVLAWFTLRRLAELADELDMTVDPLAMANGFGAAVGRHFTLDDPTAGTIWAYAVDGHGGTLAHHDANDLPTALAPLWGFCRADDPTWRATMEFAFSPRNDAYAEGPVGGLGSHHTAGTWSLGLIQEWVYRSLVDDGDGARDTLRRLLGVACADGSLPEASDRRTGRLAARPWFAWPGATVGALLAMDQGGVLEGWLA